MVTECHGPAIRLLDAQRDLKHLNGSLLIPKEEMNEKLMRMLSNQDRQVWGAREASGTAKRGGDKYSDSTFPVPKLEQGPMETESEFLSRIFQQSNLDNNILPNLNPDVKQALLKGDKGTLRGLIGDSIDATSGIRVPAPTPTQHPIANSTESSADAVVHLMRNINHPDLTSGDVYRALETHAFDIPETSQYLRERLGLVRPFSVEDFTRAAGAIAESIANARRRQQ